MAAPWICGLKTVGLEALKQAFHGRIVCALLVFQRLLAERCAKVGSQS